MRRRHWFLIGGLLAVVALLVVSAVAISFGLDVPFWKGFMVACGVALAVRAL